MNICFCGHFSGGGTERITLQLANELIADEDFSVTIINTGEKAFAFPVHDRINVQKTTGRSLRNKISEIRKLIKHYKIDVVITVEALAGIYTIPATLGLKVKNIVWEHANYFQTQGSRWTRLIRKLWLRYAEGYVVLTKRDLKNFTENESPRCEIRQIYNPVRLLSETSGKYDSSSHIIISAGHIVPIKQFGLIPEIFAPVSKRHPGWAWHIYGDATDEIRDDLEKKIEDYGMSGRIILKGRTADLDRIYDTAAMYVLTSRQEGLPTVLLEAMMHGLPCVSFDIETGPDEIITNGVNGYLVPPDDIVGMSDIIEELISDKDKRICLSENTNRIFQRFDYDGSVSEWKNLLMSL